MYRSIDRAPRLPSATASISIPGPRWASPPAKMPGRFVARVRGSTTKAPCAFTANACVASRKELSGACATAAIIVSASITNSEPATGIGRRLPLASGSPSSMRWQRMAATPPSTVSTATGAVRSSSLTPSRSASSTSQSFAGISSRERR